MEFLITYLLNRNKSLQLSIDAARTCGIINVANVRSKLKNIVLEPDITTIKNIDSYIFLKVIGFYKQNDD
jgi:hypothetical protein